MCCLEALGLRKNIKWIQRSTETCIDMSVCRRDAAGQPTPESSAHDFHASSAATPVSGRVSLAASDLTKSWSLVHMRLRSVDVTSNCFPGSDCCVIATAAAERCSLCVGGAEFTLASSHSFYKFDRERFGWRCLSWWQSERRFLPGDRHSHLILSFRAFTQYHPYMYRIKTWWLWQLYSMFIYCKHSGTGSWNKKTNKTTIYVGAYQLLPIHLCVSKMNFQPMRAARVRPVQPSDGPALCEWSPRCLFGKYRAASLPSIQTNSCHWWVAWWPRPDLLGSPSHESRCGRCVSPLRHIDQRQRLKLIQRLPGKSWPSTVEQPCTDGIYICGSGLCHTELLRVCSQGFIH